MKSDGVTGAPWHRGKPKGRPQENGQHTGRCHSDAGRLGHNLVHPVRPPAISPGRRPTSDAPNDTTTGSMISNKPFCVYKRHDWEASLDTVVWREISMEYLRPDAPPPLRVRPLAPQTLGEAVPLGDGPECDAGRRPGNIWKGGHTSLQPL